MDSSGQRLLQLWEKIDLHAASVQERIDAAWLSGESKDRHFLTNLRALLEDQDGQVRYYALQASVLDLRDASPEMVDLCWRFIEEDPDDDVRLMATTCLGSILFNSRDPASFQKMIRLLRRADLTSYVKGGLYDCLFKIAGRPPSEWPGLQEHNKRPFQECDIDWKKVEELSTTLVQRS